VPRYRAGIAWEDSKSRVVLQISIRLVDFAPDKLVRLAETLKQHYRDREYIGILIFSSHDAAMHCNPAPYGDGFPPRNGGRPHSCLESLHANYTYDAIKREEHLDLMPWHGSVDGGPLATRFDLPLVGAPQCRLQIMGRCLLALSDFTYPSEALKRKSSGTVVLTGEIKRNGKVAALRVAESDVNPVEGKDILARAALENLKAWRFDAGERDDPIRITYSYVIDASLPRGAPPGVEWGLPNQVTIRGNPPE
jgi:TonB family protein